MNLAFATTLAPYLASTAVSLALAVYGYRHREIPAARPFLVFTLGQAVWTQGYVCELLANSLTAKIVWDSYQFIGTFAASVATLFIAQRYTRQSVRHPKRFLLALLAVPILVTTAALTEPLHHLMRRSAHIVPGEVVGALWYDFTLVDDLGLIFIYGVIAWSLGIMVHHYRRGSYLVRRQTAVLIVGILIPLVFCSLIMFVYNPLSQRDSSPFAFLLGGLIQGWGLFRVRLFELLPVAREVLFEEINSGVLVVAPDGRIVDSNPAALALLALDAATTVGRNVTEIAAEVGLGLPNQTAKHPVTEVRCKCGDCRWLETTFQVLNDDHGVHCGTLFLLRDVTEARQRELDLEAARNNLERKVRERTLALSEEIEQRRQAEVALKESEYRFRAIFNQSFQLVGLLDPNGTLVDCNQSALSLIGRQLTDVVGRPFWETPWWSNSREQAERVRGAVRTAATGEFVRFEVVHESVTGELRNVDFSLKPVKDEQGRVILIIPEGRDVTDLKHSERERQGMAVKLLQAERLEALGRLAGGVAHDFNNLLTVIVGDLSLLGEGRALDDDQTEALHGALEATQRAAALTRQLLAFSRRQVLEPKVFEPTECLRNLKQILDRMTGEAIPLTLDIVGEPGPIFMDPSQFEQIIMNLVINARDAMPDGGRLTLELARVNGNEAGDKATTAAAYVKLTVTDTGVGIDKHVLPHLFEPFFTTKEPGKGTGLGLATVHGIVTQAAGTVSIESAKDRGTSIRVYLPCCTNAIDATATASPPVPGTTVVARVLLVEDQASVRELITRTLKRFGFMPLAHADAKDALEYATTNRNDFDIVLTDVVMPNMGGRALADALRQIRPSVPIVFMSGHADDSVLRKDVEHSQEHFIAKPFTPTALIEKLRSVLS